MEEFGIGISEVEVFNIQKWGLEVAEPVFDFFNISKV